jgi:hypothetical protein
MITGLFFSRLSAKLFQIENDRVVFDLQHRTTCFASLFYTDSLKCICVEKKENQ